MNRFSIACRAFREGLSTQPSVSDIRESKISEARRSLNFAVEDAKRLAKQHEDAVARIKVLETKLEQLQKLPDEAFAILAS